MPYRRNLRSTKMRNLQTDPDFENSDLGTQSNL